MELQTNYTRELEKDHVYNLIKKTLYSPLKNQKNLNVERMDVYVP